MKHLSFYRRKKGLTQEELGKRLGVTQAAVNSWERGSRVPASGKLPLIAKILECSIDDLFGKEG